MSTPIELGSTREMWFGALSDTNPAFSFLEDAIGTGKSVAQFTRQLRLGDPINTGPSSTWHQLTWQGGGLQDIWSDEQMYQRGNADVLSYTGKMKMWPGLQSWWKNENNVHKRSLAMCQGSRSDLDWRLTTLYIGQRDHGPWESRSADFHLYQLHPGYGRGDSRTVQHIFHSPEPFRFITSIQADDYTTGIMLVGTATKLYFLDESANALFQDTGAPATTAAGFEFQWDSCVTYNDSIYYTHGNRLFKRRPKPPYGVIGTHTLIKTVNSADSLRGMCVWNNRLYFGAFSPSGRGSVYVSDGSTTTKAFDFPVDLYIHKMVSCAGSLYIMGVQASGLGQDTGSPNLVQQLWRYDGRSLKKLWQEGKFDDGQVHWGSDLIAWNGYVVWGCQGTNTSYINTGNPQANFASLMFYDPINDAIVAGPGLATDAANASSLWITGLCTWNNTIAINFKDDTVYSSSNKSPQMVATIRGEDRPRNDLRWPINGDANQFQDQPTLRRSNFMYSSEYHGDDDVASDRKTWLAVKMRVKLTGANVGVKVSARRGIDDTSEFFLTPAIIDDGGHEWQDVTIPIKNGANYITSKKLQLKFELYSDDFNLPDSTQMAWIDDVAVEYMLTPVKRRQWQVRIPVTDAQQMLTQGANSLTTANALAQKLEDYAFGGVPIKFWEPAASGATPSAGSAIEVRIINFQRQQARLESTDTALAGSVSLTLIENVTS